MGGGDLETKGWQWGKEACEADKDDTLLPLQKLSSPHLLFLSCMVTILLGRKSLSRNDCDITLILTPQQIIVSVHWKEKWRSLGKRLMSSLHPVQSVLLLPILSPHPTADILKAVHAY